MRYILLLALLAALTLCSFAQATTTPAGGISRSELEVRQLERAWLDAYEQFNAKTMDAIVADDFAITFPNGAIQTKPQLMESLKKPRDTAAPAMKFYTEDVQSRAYGNTVILRGRVVTQYQREGKLVKEQSRYTDTYVRRGGRWQVVASHLSNAPQPQK
ncbi:MAG: hypothetical protein QOF61_1652 [Acidobacteriota bacterium]|nr:hypothetical protein [Acidobacteriota bacterium]